MDEDDRNFAETTMRNRMQFGREQQELRNRQKNNKRKRRRREDYYDDDAEEEEDYVNCGKHKEELLPKWKMCIVGAAIFLCFALLYPSVFAPLFSSFFGGRRDQPDHRNVHPSMMGPQPTQREQRPGRPMHPHPAAAQMPQSQQEHGKGGGGRGGFAWLLPFYTVGVVCFLLYTLFKMRFKSKKKKKGKNRHVWDEDEASEEEDAGICGARGQKLRSVQSRLHKTEHAMQEILQQLELIANQSQQMGQGQQEAGSQEATPAQPTATGGTHPKPQGNNNDLTNEQTAQMEMRLKMLSEMCRREKLFCRRLRDHSSTEMSDEEELAYDEEEDVNNGEGTDSQTDEASEEEEPSGGGRMKNE